MSKYSVVHIYVNCFECKLVLRNENTFYHLFKSKLGYLREDIKKKKNCRFGENVTIGGEGGRKIIDFSSFTNDEKHGRGGV